MIVCGGIVSGGNWLSQGPLQKEPRIGLHTKGAGLWAEEPPN